MAEGDLVAAERAGLLLLLLLPLLLSLSCPEFQPRS
jgi:hypothetical protein